MSRSHTCTIGLYLHPRHDPLGCLTFGLLLVRYGLCAHFDAQGNYGSAVYPYNRSSPSPNLFRDGANLRTIIVIADIDRGLHSPAKHPKTLHHPCLTFRHWSGVTPYTSSCEFAGSCVFGKQSPGNLSLRPPRPKARGRPYPEVTAACLPSSLRASHSFALVFSTLPPVSVCGTEPTRLKLRSFSWKRAHPDCGSRGNHSPLRLE